MNNCSPRTRSIYDCPVRADTRKIQDLGKEMLKSMRRLRISLRACDHCDLVEECTFREEFNGIVNRVVDEILEGWNLPSRDTDNV